MWEKIKAGALYILAPLLALGGLIVYLLSRISELKSKVGQATAEKDLVQVIEKKEEAVHEAKMSSIQADNAQSNYESLRQEYLRRQPDSEPKSDT